jgi:hypothetical protein
MRQSSLPFPTIDLHSFLLRLKLTFRPFRLSSQFAANNAWKNFPSLAPAESERDQPDFASVVQAMIELTQTMTACAPSLVFPSVGIKLGCLRFRASCIYCRAHDILYPSTERTNTLSKDGSYYKYLDEVSSPSTQPTQIRSFCHPDARTRFASAPSVYDIDQRLPADLVQRPLHHLSLRGMCLG